MHKILKSHPIGIVDEEKGHYMEIIINNKHIKKSQDYLRGIGVNLPDDDRVMVSYRGIRVAPLKNGPQDWQELIAEIEEYYGLKVYHIIYDIYSFGECLTLLFMEKSYRDEEQLLFDAPERYKDTNLYTFYSYVINLSEPMFGEFGSVTTYVQDGVLRRIESNPETYLQFA